MAGKKEAQHGKDDHAQGSTHDASHQHGHEHGHEHAHASAEAPRSKESAMQRLYLEAQIMDQQMRMLQQQVEKIEEQMAEYEALKMAIDELKGVKQGSDVLVPFANGIFLKAKITDTDAFIINIGSQTAVEKDAAGTKQLLVEQQQSLTEAHIHFTKQLQQFSQRFQDIERDLE